MAVVYSQTVRNDERGRCEVWVSIPRKSQIRKTQRAQTAEPQKFSSNFHTDAHPATRKMWIEPSRFANPTRREPNATPTGNVRPAIRACRESGERHSANSGECCSASTVSHNARNALRGLHSKVTNAVLYLANTDAAFVVFESRLMAASSGSGEMEASLAGKAPEFRFGALSLQAVARPHLTLPVSPAFERPALCRRARKSSACRSYRSGMTMARRRGEGVGVGGCRKV